MCRGRGALHSRLTYRGRGVKDRMGGLMMLRAGSHASDANRAASPLRVTASGTIAGGRGGMSSWVREHRLLDTKLVARARWISDPAY
jgi:hypothetical protein